VVLGENVLNITSVFGTISGGSTPFNLFFSILKILMGKYHFLEG
jgi:hypothetical protein